ncbi:PaREP1 family protein [Sulfolobus acidocaldarius]|uniref:PaREP1 family protein n=1 Tax=Sulfolobus acidocaldarius TaxID=2285 RepID=UPI0030B9C96B
MRSVQASEKYYKASEESIKILSSVLELEVINKISNEGWSGELLNKCVFSLSSIFGKWIIESWGSAIALITVNMDSQQVNAYRENILKLVQVADERLNNKVTKRG